MSYILDALKKADADREREAAAVPNLHAQGDAAFGPASARPAGWLLLAIAAAAVALVVLGWRWVSAPPQDPKPAPALAQTPATPLPQLAAPLPATRPPSTEGPVQPSAPQPVTPRAPVIATVSPSPRRAAQAPAPPPALTSTTPTPVAATQADAPKPAASAVRLPTLAELPADVRGQMPALTVGGSVYSPQAASRIVILNGQVFREGDKPIDGLTVEQIGLRSTVLAFRGTRFELKH